MSLLVEAWNGFYNVCSLLAKGVKSIADGADFIIQLNYNLVETSGSFVYRVVSTIVITAIQVCNVLRNIFENALDFLFKFHSFITSILCLIWRGFTQTYHFINLCCDTTTSFFWSLTVYMSEKLSTMWQTALSVYEDTSNFIYSIYYGIIFSVSSIVMFFTSIGTGCVNLVKGAWYLLGYVLSWIAWFPIHIIECVEAAKENVINLIVHAVTFTPKETYLGIICLCLLYFILSNTFRYLSCHGMPLFSSRFRSRSRRNPNFDWQFDRGFESDFEDLYNSDTDDRVWTNGRRGNVDSDVENSEDSASEDSNSNASGTVDNDISDGDDVDEDDGSDDDDERTNETEDSDSDASFNSQTFSTESSDHEIDVQLPSMEDRYSLRSRSSTPSCPSRSLSCPEDFDREMEKERDKRKCVVCQDNIKSVLVLPCRHMCLCVDCADHLVRARLVMRKVCPLCRTRIEKVMNVYV